MSADNMYVLAGIAVGAILLLVALFLMFKKPWHSGPGLGPKYAPFKLARKTKVSHNTFKFTFDLQTPNTKLGLPVGKHMLLKFDKDGKPISRPYTPISSDDDLGHFELVIKTYPDGLMSQHLEAMRVGQSIEVRGPLGDLEYHGNGRFHIKMKNPSTHRKELVKKTVRNVAMIAGGTGITPMLQIIRDISKRSSDNTNVSLIFGNQTVDDILLREELEEESKISPNFKCFFTLDRPPAGWGQGSGFVTTDMIREHLPPPSKDTLVCLCGPPKMVEFMEKNLLGMGYAQDSIFAF